MRHPSLKRNFAWTLAGNAVYAAGQWGILSLFAKLAGSEMLGEYALAVALTAPVGMLAHLNLRSVIATDVKRAHSLGDYVAARWMATAAGLAAMAGIAWISSESAEGALVIFAVGAGQSSETISDLYYGAMQRREELDRVAKSLMTRTLLSLASLGLMLWATGSLLYAVLALSAARVAVLVVYDQRVGRAGEALQLSGNAAPWAVLRSALPLGFVLMLISLNTQLPRYAIEREMGPASLGLFAAVVSFITVGSTMVNALGQTATSRLAGLFAAGNRSTFVWTGLRMAAFVGALGVAGVAVAWAVGDLVLALIYRPEYAEWQPLLIAAMGAGMLAYLAIFLGYAVTSARVFGAQMPLFGISALGCGVASWLLVPRWGLYGGVIAIALASGVQIAGQLWLLARALRQQERNA